MGVAMREIKTNISQLNSDELLLLCSFEWRAKKGVYVELSSVFQVNDKRKAKRFTLLLRANTTEKDWYFLTPCCTAQVFIHSHRYTTISIANTRRLWPPKTDPTRKSTFWKSTIWQYDKELFTNRRKVSSVLERHVTWYMNQEPCYNNFGPHWSLIIHLILWEERITLTWSSIGTIRFPSY